MRGVGFPGRDVVVVVVWILFGFLVAEKSFACISSRVSCYRGALFGECFGKKKEVSEKKISHVVCRARFALYRTSMHLRSSMATPRRLTVSSSAARKHMRGS